MRHAISIFKLFGIEVDLDYSWFLIFLLMVWSLSGHHLMAYQGSSTGLRLALAVITAVLFFASVLAHEFGHSLVAMATGVPVRRITLFIFGGVAQLTREPRRARDEFVIALAGPAVSLLLAGGFGAIWLLSRLAGWQSLGMVTGWLATINLLLALFNLIPGFPLDGGRVFRAIVWGATGSLQRATSIAGRGGQLIAYLFIIGGIWQIFGGTPSAWGSGLWIAFIGWFLYSAATDSLRQRSLREALRGYTARDVTCSDCPRVPRTMTLEHLVHKGMLPSSRRCFPVVENEHFYGLVTMRDVTMVAQSAWPTTTVADLMIPRNQLEIIRPDEALYDILDRMTAADVDQMPVMDAGQFRGMVRRDELLACIQTQIELRTNDDAVPRDREQRVRPARTDTKEAST